MLQLFFDTKPNIFTSGQTMIHRCKLKFWAHQLRN